MRRTLKQRSAKFIPLTGARVTQCVQWSIPGRKKCREEETWLPSVRGRLGWGVDGLWVEGDTRLVLLSPRFSILASPPSERTLPFPKRLHFRFFMHRNDCFTKMCIDVQIVHSITTPLLSSPPVMYEHTAPFSGHCCPPAVTIQGEMSLAAAVGSVRAHLSPPGVSCNPRDLSPSDPVDIMDLSTSPLSRFCLLLPACQRRPPWLSADRPPGLLTSSLRSHPYLCCRRTYFRKRCSWRRSVLVSLFQPRYVGEF